MAVSQTKEVVPLSLTSESLRALLCAASHAPSHGDRHNGPLGTRGGRTAGRRSAACVFGLNKHILSSYNDSGQVTTLRIVISSAVNSFQLFKTKTNSLIASTKLSCFQIATVCSAQRFSVPTACLVLKCVSLTA